MSKRSTIVVSSSEDEDKDGSFNSKRGYSKCKSRRKNPSGAKKARISGSRPRLCRDSSVFDEMRLFCEEFGEGLTGFKVSAGSSRCGGKELWVDKYKPRSLEELAVHKKKVEEVTEWFEKRLRTSREEMCNLLVITGQAGVGKSATIHAIASHLGARLCEWNTPIPTIWREHLHNTNSGIRYTSKLDEFESFVERMRKYGLIPPSFAGESKSSVILLIDDLPVTNGNASYRRLRNCLQLLAQSTQIPTAILITDYGKADSADNIATARCLEELQLSLENAGACKIAFNPITSNSIKKTLSKICRQEQCGVTADQIDLIARSSGGDIRHAITSLQYFCLKPDPMLSLSFSEPARTYSKEKSDELNPLDDGFSLPFGRDETLSLFHALGKFLHNKRESENAIAPGQEAFLVRERLTRLPLKMDAPERVLCQAHVQARPVVDFLHENATSYEAGNVLQSAAASVAARGVLFGNSHPLASRWHAIRRPKLWQVEQSSLHNKCEILGQRLVALSTSNVSVIATEYIPMFKWLRYGASGGFEDYQGLIQGNETELDDNDSMILDEKENEISDDEIEDWEPMPVRKLKTIM
ncbi:cell cycle checkpoint protein RAD17 isoform X4 [Vitis riparia]|uniref:cell cycle checkpoint protein RAD17 isoform X4 n=1 Tax=Vitis riparia TaxID=96939 RepID=UPI00155A70C5|nr:cell cycle checkpoint protein RAD17 isoform X4 [Vitis riparia]